MRWLRRGIVGAALLIAALSAAAKGEAPEAKGETGSHYDSIQLRPRTVLESKSRDGSAPASGAMEASRVLAALAAVIALIFGVRWAGRRFLGMNAIVAGGGGAVRVLSKTVLSPKQQLMLVQVGRRVVLVANTGVQMNALCEISDPEEVADLVGAVQARPERIVGAAGSFLAAFGHAGNTYSSEMPIARDVKGADRDPAHRSIEPPTRAELAGLLEKVRLMSGAFRKG